MRARARTPEELETLLEDAFVVRDDKALAPLFEDDAVLVTGDGPREARGGEEIARFATAMWDRPHLCRQSASDPAGAQHRPRRGGTEHQCGAPRRRRDLAVRDLTPVSRRSDK